MSHDPFRNAENGIAVIGMACRFPGAPDLDTFWHNLRTAQHGISFMAADANAPEGYVPARGLLDQIDQFDAEAFGLSARDALLMDPQQRLLFETALHAFDHAGVDPNRSGEATGVFTGVGAGSYAHRLWQSQNGDESIGMMQLEIGNDKDYSAPRLSYLLNLRGPSIPVQTACSTSLVAVHAAVQSLLSNECDLALAGGCSLPYLEPTGYQYREDDIYAPDGFCRSFDAQAGGTVPGSGVGLVVLKRLDEARQDGDRIMAVILATAVNNDGDQKVGFTAPSVTGQRTVIEDALSLADVDPGHIGFVETHGTATRLGDPIEIEALRQAFGQDGRNCALGAVKSNIGHAGAAAGIAGFIKTVLCRAHNTLVPTLHYTAPNPKLNLDDSPFFVNTATQPWPQEQPLAGVSSFGIGGTNCHLILAPAPQAGASQPSPRRTQLLTLAAKNETALAQHADNLAEALSTDDAPDLADVAFSLNGARKAFSTRTWLTAADHAEAVVALRRLANAPNPHHAVNPPVVFCFTGQGVEGGDWGAALFQEEPVFRQAALQALTALAPHLDFDLAAVMFRAETDLSPPSRYQPALFVLGYALASLWQSLAVKPTAVLGHSLGEYAAAVVAGVLSLEDAAKLVAERAQQTERLPGGAMLALPISADQTEAWCSDQVALAAVNGANLCVFSGPYDAVDALATRAKDAGLEPIRFPTSHAFHSPMTAPALAPLTAAAQTTNPQAATIPFASTVTGTWLTTQDARDPQYWARQMAQTVRFHDAVLTAAEYENALFLEIGPGRVLSRLVARSLGADKTVASLEPDRDSAAAFSHALGSVWARGVAIAWSAWFAEEQRQKVTLPAYPFQRRRYWVEAESNAVTDARGLLETRRPANEWYYRPAWQQIVAPAACDASALEPEQTWLLLFDDGRLADALSASLTQAGQHCVHVRRGHDFSHDAPNCFTLNPATGFPRLLQQLEDQGRRPDNIVHGWSLAMPAVNQTSQVAVALDAGFAGLMHLSKALTEQHPEQVRLSAVTRNMWSLADADGTDTAWQATLLGATTVLPLEFEFLKTCCIDIGDSDTDQAVAAIAARFVGDWDDDTTLHAHGMLWRRDFQRIAAPPEPPAAAAALDGVYLILNGFQEFGYDLCRHLQDQGAAAVLVDRAFLPPAHEWDTWLAEQGGDDWTSQVINNLRSVGERVFTKTANPTDAGALAAVTDQVRREHGRLDGVFVLDRGARAGLIQTKSSAEPAPFLAEKMSETLAVGAVMADLDTVMVFTTNADDAGGIGQSEHAAAYAFQESYYRRLPCRAGQRRHVIEWGGLPSDSAPGPESGLSGQLIEKQKRFGLDSADRLTVAARLLPSQQNYTVVSTRDYGAVLAQRRTFTAAYFKDQAAPSATEERPDLTTAYLAPSSDVERLLAELWEAAFAVKPIGIDDDFFELGGHSLLAVDLLASMSKVFATNVGLEVLFANPTIAALARVLAGDELESEDAELTAALLDRIEDLSPEEIEAMLAEVENE